MSTEDVAKRMHWSLSKVNRIENGAVTVTPTDLQALAWWSGKGRCRRS